ncbi:MAG: hypothetical protein KDD70_09905, partial [Bdellovibrionales bacterium]|nr:hypothetical protein [Bdellovibrionales bacterium]
MQMRQYTIFVVFFLFSLLGALPVYAQSCSANQLGGVVFRDYNADGARGTYEPGQSGIVVTVFSSDGATLASGTTGSDGTFVLSNVPDGSDVRVEFSQIPDYLFPGPDGSSNGTTTQFVTQNSNCTVNLGLSAPAEYCQSDPLLITPCYVNGDPLLAGTAASADSFVAWQYSENGQPAKSTATGPKHWAINSQTGPTWGVAVQRSTQTVFTTALMKRHSGFGPLGPSGLYSVDATDPDNVSVTSFINLATIGIDAGADPHAGVGANLIDPSLDAASYQAVGKIGFGDLDISEDEQTLWLVNLQDRTLYSIFIGVPAQVPTAAQVTAYPISNPGCTNNDYRPWGIGIQDGQVYVGVICTGETSENNNDLQLYVQQLQSDGSFLSVINFALDYTKGYPLIPAFVPLPGVNNWQHWADDFNADVTNAAVANSFIAYPQPILSDIEFDTDGSMILGLLDRSGHQLGRLNFIPTAATPINPPSGGDMLRACKTGSNTWTLESNGSCPGGSATSGAGNNQGPGGGEYYFADFRTFPAPNENLDAHQELVVGGLASIKGTNEVVASVYDPYEFETGGTITFSNTTGDRVRAYEVYPSFLGNLGKAAGVGDLELLCDPAPIEIGNRVWIDTDRDGVQDPGEAPIVGATVRLLTSSRTVIATTTTNSNGEYLFTRSDGAQINTNYIVTLNEASDYQSGGPLAGYLLTSADQNEDQRDSDGVTASTGYPEIDLTTGVAGENNHTYDFGFQTADCDVTDLSISSATIDGGAAELLDIHRRIIAFRRAQRKSGRCSDLSVDLETKSLARVTESYEEIWRTTWTDLPRQSYSCDQVLAA